MKSETTKREADEPKESKQLGFDLQLTNFGPIAGGKISLKPLTVFIGPNNSGKSYAAMLINSILETVTATLLKQSKSVRRRWLSPRIPWQKYPDLPKKIFWVKDDDGKITITQQAKKIGESVAREIFEQSLDAAIATAFASPLDELVNFGKESFVIKVAFNNHAAELNYALRQRRLGIKKFPSSSVEIKKAGSELRVMSGESDFGVSLKGFFDSDSGKQIVAEDLIFAIAYQSLESAFNHLYMPCHYLPAARSGILQGHRAVAASLVQNPELGGLSGVARNLISSLINLPSSKGPFSELAKEFENELIGGQITVPENDSLYPEIKYRVGDTNISLHRASSTVSELAPLFLYLKYYITPGSVLIIEEPEAHLHPSNIRKLAKWLVRLRRQGVNLILTTHSQYLLEQLSNFIMLQRVSATKRKEKYGYDKNDFLKPEEVGVFFFKRDKRSDGFKITTVPVDAVDGIAEEGFAEVHDGLYEEAIRLERDLTPKGQKCD
jgi:predicted ATPase